MKRTAAPFLIIIILASATLLYVRMRVTEARRAYYSKHLRSVSAAARPREALPRPISSPAHAPRVSAPEGAHPSAAPFTLKVEKAEGETYVWLTARDADLKRLLAAMAKESGVRMAADADLFEKVTADFSRCPLDDCLRKISPNFCLTYVKSGGRTILSEATILRSAINEAGRQLTRAPRTHIATLRYGSGAGEVGFVNTPEVERQGPESFAVDAQGNVCICDTVNGRVQIISPEGKPLAQFPVNGRISDIAVDERGDIFILNETAHALQRYDRSGGMTGEIPLPPDIFAAKGILTYQGRKFYLSDHDQYTRELARLENGNLATGSMKKTAGAHARVVGDYLFMTRRVSGESSEIRVMDGEGNAVRTIGLNIPGLLSIVFLGQDVKGNGYIQIEESKGPAEVGLRVLKVSPGGGVIGSTDYMPNKYMCHTARLLTVTQKGTIYQMLPTGTGCDLNIYAWEQDGK